MLLLKWFGLTWQVALVDGLITSVILLLISLLLINTLRFYNPRRERYVHIVVWVIFLTAIWLAVSVWLLKLSLGHVEGYVEFTKNSLPVRGSIGFLIVSILTLVGILWFNWEEQKENEHRKRDAERLTREAELFKLRQQLQPHFLFNSLNSINALVGSRPEQARKMIQQLSDFLRGTLKKEEHHLVSLSEEMQYLQLYLDIEKVRFGNRLSTEIRVDDNAKHLKLPTLLLQPIVENAIKFGLYDTTGQTNIVIYATVNSEQLDIRVENPFDPETATPKQGTGFGLNSVHRRLQLLYARADLLKTSIHEKIFITSVSIPQVDTKTVGV